MMERTYREAISDCMDLTEYGTLPICFNEMVMSLALIIEHLAYLEDADGMIKSKAYKALSGYDFLNEMRISVELNQFLKWLFGKEVVENDDPESLWYSRDSIIRMWNKFVEEQNKQ